MKIDLSGKTALVTGASRGIGRAIAEALGECGAKVAVHFFLNEAEAANAVTAIGNAQAFQADLNEPGETLRLFKEVEEAFGHIHIVVNNAGIAYNSPVDGSDEEFIKVWQETMEVNLNSMGLLCKKAIQHFQQHDGGKIINIASRAAFRGDTKDYLAYAASKAGIVALTRSIARAYGKDNIVAFNVAPGFTRTEKAQDAIDAYGEDFVTSDLALGVLTEPTDIAPTVAFLASGMADHATGATIDINAGSYVH